MEQTIEQEIGVDGRPSISLGEAIWATLAYLGVWLFLPLGLKRRSPFINHHLKQGLVLLIIEMISTFIFIIPLAGWMIGLFGWTAAVIFSLLGLVMALRKRYWAIPVLGKISEKIKL